jgi:dolichol-phosphate mannosyltransferase
MNLSIIIPAFNEAENIADVIMQIKNSVQFDFELIVVNDHSQDSTSSIVEDLSKQFKNLRLVENNRPRGFANAINTGFEHAQGDVILPIMGDLCDDLTTIGKMLCKINQGYDIVCGSRYMRGGRRIGGSKMKAFLSSFAGKSLHILLGIPTCDIANAFKMYKKEVIRNIEIKSEGFEISMEIPIKAYFLGYKITEVPTVWRERQKGESSFNILKLCPAYFKLYLKAIFRRMAK